MRQSSCIRYLVVAALLLGGAACSETYPYIPSLSKSAAPAAPAPTEAAPSPETTAPPAASPAPANPERQNLEARVQQLEGRVAELEGRRTVTPAARERATATSVAVYPKAPAAAPAAGGDKLLAEGLRLYQAKKYGEARTKFHQYLNSQPKGPRDDEARYYLADSFYQEARYKEAAVEFNKLVTQYPKGKFAPAALLRQALSYKNQNQTQNYQTALKKLIKTYPSSQEAKEAQKWMKEEKAAPSR
jgi:tol-pal system protein YbgF